MSTFLKIIGILILIMAFIIMAFTPSGWFWLFLLALAVLVFIFDHLAFG